MKARLLNYKADKFQALNSTGLTYILEIERSYFGLWKYIVKKEFEIPYHGSIKKHKEHWDSLIKSGKIIKF